MLPYGALFAKINVHTVLNPQVFNYLFIQYKIDILDQSIKPICYAISSCNINFV